MRIVRGRIPTISATEYNVSPPPPPPPTPETTCPLVAPGGILLTFSDTTTVGPLGKQAPDCLWSAGVASVTWSIWQFGNMDAASQALVVSLCGFTPAANQWIYYIGVSGVATVVTCYTGNSGSTPSADPLQWSASYPAGGATITEIDLLP